MYSNCKKSRVPCLMRKYSYLLIYAFSVIRLHLQCRHDSCGLAVLSSVQGCLEFNVYSNEINPLNSKACFLVDWIFLFHFSHFLYKKSHKQTVRLRLFRFLSCVFGSPFKNFVLIISATIIYSYKLLTLPCQITNHASQYQKGLIETELNHIYHKITR